MSCNYYNSTAYPLVLVFIATIKCRLKEFSSLSHQHRHHQPTVSSSSGDHLNHDHDLASVRRVSSVSTMETMYGKIISLPAVHYIEDTLASIHDSTGG